MTRRHFFGILALASLAGAGCGGAPTPSAPGAPPPHNGALTPLPEGLGFAEVLKQTAPGKAGQSKVVVYFLGPDRVPMTPDPSAVTVKGSATANKAIPLEPIGGGFASPPMADRGEVDFELAATIAGKPVTVPISVR